MRFRSLDGTGDWNFGKGLESYATNDNAIAFDVQTSILSFFKDCWFDPNAGLDWFRLMGTKTTANEIKLSVRGAILQCNGVTKVNSVGLVYQGRKLSVTYDINTIFSNNNTEIVEVL